MHVTDIEVVPISYRPPDGQDLGDARRFSRDRAATLIRVDTDTGGVGWGGTFAPGSATAPVVNEFFRGNVVGMDSLDVRRSTEESYTDPYRSGGSVFVQSALSGIDVTFWDLVDKVTGKPVYQLLGGTPRETLTTYASTMYFTEADRNIAAPIRDTIDEGLSAAKIKTDASTNSSVERVRTARQLLGGDAWLMVGINGNYRS